jgi:transposase InsO family protein
MATEAVHSQNRGHAEDANIGRGEASPRSPNLNAFAERWVHSIKNECISKLILFGEASLHRRVTQFIEHYHLERLQR